MPSRILIADPVGGDVDFLARFLRGRGASVETPETDSMWQERARECDALIVNLVKVDAAVIDSMSRCRVIARLGIGTDNIDVDAARAKGITVTNVAEYCTEEVSDHALGLILASVRKIGCANDDIQRGLWQQLGYRPIRRISQLNLGLVGVGKLARALAIKARAIGFRVIAHDPFVSSSDLAEWVTLPTLLAEADVISLHAPSTPATYHMINRDALKLLKRGAIVVNTSRGDLIDEQALIEALDDGRVGCAALDVFEHEPLSSSSELRGRSNVLLTPHMAFYSEESLEDLQRQAAEDVLAVLSGRAPRNRVG